jgi:PKD repeat protein
LAALQIVTWNDYEEGTAIESGIDNCTYLTPSISGSSLHWAVSGGSENTIDHYTVFFSTDGKNLEDLADVPAGKHSFDLSSQSSGTFYIKAVGKASFQNKMSPGIAYKQGDQSPTAVLAVSLSGSLTIGAATDGSADSDGSIAGSTIDFGDGTVLSGPHATHTYNAAGIYNVVASVVDNGGASTIAIKQVSAKATASGVKILAPSNGATVNWPTSIVASANMGNPVASMKVLVDDAPIYAVNDDVINTVLKIFTGTHQITIQATDNTGATSSSSITVNAEPTDQAPIADVAVFPLPGVAPHAVLACTMNSRDPDGFINARQVTFSDGVTVKASGAVHTFAAPGIYSATATVTDQYGATDAATDTFTVP